MKARSWGPTPPTEIAAAAQLLAALAAKARSWGHTHTAPVVGRCTRAGGGRTMPSDVRQRPGDRHRRGPLGSRLCKSKVAQLLAALAAKALLESWANERIVALPRLLRSVCSKSLPSRHIVIDLVISAILRGPDANTSLSRLGTGQPNDPEFGVGRSILIHGLPQSGKSGRRTRIDRPRWAELVPRAGHAPPERQ